MIALHRISHRRPKVVHVCAIDWTVQALLKPQILALKGAGYDVYAMCAPDKYGQSLKDDGIEMIPLDIHRSITPFRDLKTLWQLYRVFRREKFDIVHTHTAKVSLLGQMAAWLAGVPVIVNTVHGFYFHENMKPAKRWFYIAMEWLAAKCSTMILSQNPEDVATAIKLGLGAPTKIKLLGNGVDLTEFAPDRFDADFKSKKRAEIDIDNSAIVVGIIGRLVREKGYLELFEAMGKVISENRNVRLLIIGPEEPEKADRISATTFRQYNIAEQTRWLGHRDDVPELLACCDIYVLPSWREGFPRSAIEAAAMALPIVATNIRGCRQVVNDGVTGLLVPIRNSTELGDAITRLVNNESLRHKMGQAGFEKAKREFDERKVCKIVVDTYRTLLENRGSMPEGHYFNDG